MKLVENSKNLLKNVKNFVFFTLRFFIYVFIFFFSKLKGALQIQFRNKWNVAGKGCEVIFEILQITIKTYPISLNITVIFRKIR